MSDPRYVNYGTPITRLTEECGELIVALMKVQRFGWDSRDPDKPESANNFDQVRMEMNDTRETMDELWKQMLIIKGNKS